MILERTTASITKTQHRVVQIDRLFRDLGFSKWVSTMSSEGTRQELVKLFSFDYNFIANNLNFRACSGLG